MAGQLVRGRPARRLRHAPARGRGSPPARDRARPDPCAARAGPGQGGGPQLLSGGARPRGDGRAALVLPQYAAPRPRHPLMNMNSASSPSTNSTGWMIAPPAIAITSRITPRINQSIYLSLTSGVYLQQRGSTHIVRK